MEMYQLDIKTNIKMVHKKEIVEQLPDDDSITSSSNIGFQQNEIGLCNTFEKCLNCYMKYHDFSQSAPIDKNSSDHKKNILHRFVPFAFISPQF